MDYSIKKNLLIISNINASKSAQIQTNLKTYGVKKCYFYNISEGKYLAIGLNGKIYESADSELDLVSKLQGKKYDAQVFAWHSGFDVFSGWRT